MKTALQFLEGTTGDITFSNGKVEIDVNGPSKVTIHGRCVMTEQKEDGSKVIFLNDDGRFAVTEQKEDGSKVTILDDKGFMNEEKEDGDKVTAIFANEEEEENEGSESTSMPDLESFVISDSDATSLEAKHIMSI